MVTHTVLQYVLPLLVTHTVVAVDADMYLPDFRIKKSVYVDHVCLAHMPLSSVGAV